MMATYEEISVLVQQYECLYNKRNTLYKDKYVKQKAWLEISEQVGITEADAKRDFENMKKLYAKRRLHLKKVERSRAGANVVQKARAALHELSFLSWMDPHMKMKTTFTNIAPEDQDDDMDNLDTETLDSETQERDNEEYSLIDSPINTTPVVRDMSSDSNYMSTVTKNLNGTKKTNEPRT